MRQEKVIVIIVRHYVSKKVIEDAVYQVENKLLVFINKNIMSYKLGKKMLCEKR